MVFAFHTLNWSLFTVVLVGGIEFTELPANQLNVSVNSTVTFTCVIKTGDSIDDDSIDWHSSMVSDGALSNNFNNGIQGQIYVIRKMLTATSLPGCNLPCFNSSITVRATEASDRSAFQCSVKDPQVRTRRIYSKAALLTGTS